MASECGLGPCRPSWLGRFATFHTFLIVYGLLGTIQTMAFIYFVATLTTLEKRFKIPSRTTGIVMSGNEISQIMLSLFLSYYGGRGNRPLWISCGVAFSAVSCFILAAPHFMYGAGQDALALTVEHLDASKLLNGTYNDEAAALCSTELPHESCGEEEYSMAPVIIIFLSQFVLGIGTTLYFALGQTYLDDNTKKVHTPMLLGLVMSLRSVGPALGFIIGFGCLSLYIDPSLTPVIDKKDPRWLGAWWLGWIVLGLAMFLFAFLIALFPKKLPPRRKSPGALKVQRNASARGEVAVTHIRERQPLTKYMLDDFLPTSKSDPEPEVELVIPKPPVKMTKDTFTRALIRLLKNKLLMLNNVAAVFYILGASGYITFLTKYMETQFQKSAAGANIFAGVAGILAMVGGFLISGFVISRFRPSPRKLLAWNVLIGLVYVLGEISFIYIGCPDNGLQGAVMANGSLELSTPCNLGCNCENLKYSPVCHEQRAQTFFSACHAGCSTRLDVNGTQTFTDCKCLSDSPSPANYTNLMLGLGAEGSGSDTGNPGAPSPGQAGRVPGQTATVTAGPCFMDCAKSFYWFIVITCCMHALGSSGKIGNILVNYRSVSTEDKPFAQGLGLLMISLFAFIPGPIIYGAIIDSTCLVWNESCGNKGNCWLYHKEDFRYYLNVTAACFTTVATFFDGLVWYYGKSLDLYGEPEEVKTIDNN